jgi:hypothetical protein
MRTGAVASATVLPTAPLVLTAIVLIGRSPS